MSSKRATSTSLQTVSSRAGYCGTVGCRRTSDSGSVGNSGTSGTFIGFVPGSSSTAHCARISSTGSSSGVFWVPARACRNTTIGGGRTCGPCSSILDSSAKSAVRCIVSSKGSCGTCIASSCSDTCMRDSTRVGVSNGTVTRCSAILISTVSVCSTVSKGRSPCIGSTCSTDGVRVCIGSSNSGTGDSCTTDLCELVTTGGVGSAISTASGPGASGAIVTSVVTGCSSIRGNGSSRITCRGGGDLVTTYREGSADITVIPGARTTSRSTGGHGSSGDWRSCRIGTNGFL